MISTTLTTTPIPTPRPSRHLGPRQYHALQALGDCLIPGDSQLPPFSETECARAVDRVLDHMPAGDRGDLKTLLTVLSFFPAFALAWLLRLLEWSPAMTGPVLGAIGGPFRFVRLGIRGLVMTLYYADPKVLEILGYEVGVYTGDLAKGTQPNERPNPR